MKNLIQMQREAIDEILSLPENGNRAMGYRQTLLNKKTRSLARIRNAFSREMEKLGFDKRETKFAWGDVKDMAILEQWADS